MAIASLILGKVKEKIDRLFHADNKLRAAARTELALSYICDIPFYIIHSRVTSDHPLRKHNQLVLSSEKAQSTSTSK